MPGLVRRGPWTQWGSAFRDAPHLWAVVPAALLGWAALAQMSVLAPVHHSAPNGWPTLVVHALAMAAVMALPATNDPLRHVLRSSFPDRAVRHCALFLLAFAAAWSAFALAASLAVLASARLGPVPIAAAALLLAAAWQTLPARRNALGRCHGTIPIYPDGTAGLRSSARFGLRVGRACVVACGPLMLAAMLSPLPVPAMAAAAALAALERYGRPGAAAVHARAIAAAALLLLLLDLGLGLGLGLG